jgi:hypothetical protein
MVLGLLHSRQALKMDSSLKRTAVLWLPALTLLISTGLIVELRASGLILENDRPWMQTFATQRSPGGNNRSDKSYFTDDAGKTFSVSNSFIERVVVFPDVSEFQNITDESSLEPLLLRKAELEAVAVKVPDAKSYVANPIAALEGEMRRFHSGQHKVNGKWLTAAEVQAEEKRQIAAGRTAEAKQRAEREAAVAKQRAEQFAFIEKRRAERKAIAAKQAQQYKAAEQQRVEKEQNATAALAQSVKQFQVAEKHVAEDYQSSAKGTLSGQVFVSTNGGENVKLGAVQVSLFARDAIEPLLAQLNNFAQIKIRLQTERLAAASSTQKEADVRREAALADLAAAEEVPKLLGDATVWERISGMSDGATASNDTTKPAIRAAQEEVEVAGKAADTALEEAQKMADPATYRSEDFYFDFLQSPIRIAETDADGKFAMEIPKKGAFVISARGRRLVGENIERYYWRVPVSLEGQQQCVQNLSNSNLMRATDTFVSHSEVTNED